MYKAQRSRREQKMHSHPHRRSTVIGVYFRVLTCYGQSEQRESKNIPFPFSFSSWNKLTYNCSQPAHTLSLKKEIFLSLGNKKTKTTQKNKQKKNIVPHQLILDNSSLLLDLDQFHASCFLGYVRFRGARCPASFPSSKQMCGQGTNKLCLVHK